MKLVIYSVCLNQHQGPVSDELWEQTSHEFTFVELLNSIDTKGGTEDYSMRPYLLRAWESEENHKKAMELARTADCCIFAGVEALPYERERMQLDKLSFDMGERWLKHGLRSLLSPRLWKWLLAYYKGGWGHRRLYKLCASAYCAGDHKKLRTFQDKFYKWGYFTRVEIAQDLRLKFHGDKNGEKTARLMWCARFVDWKHPELAIKCVKMLKADGYRLKLDMYGDGPLRERLEVNVKHEKLDKIVVFHGNVPNTEIHKAMRESDIFLFTSDRKEG